MKTLPQEDPSLASEQGLLAGGVRGAGGPIQRLLANNVRDNAV